MTTPHARLIGTWRSDRLKSLLAMRKHNKVTSSQNTFFRRVFGHLRVRHTKNRIYFSLKDETDVVPYKVLGADDSSVAIAIANIETGRQSIAHIHFEGRRYWISLGGFMREYFRRVPERRRR